MAQVAAGEALAASRGWSFTRSKTSVGPVGIPTPCVRLSKTSCPPCARARGDVVVVDELSRLTRKGAHDALEIDDECKRYGVRFVSVLEPFLDTSNAIGVAIFALIAALAKQGSDIEAECLRGAKDEIRAVGGRHAGSAPYGMRAVREWIGDVVVSVLEPDEDNPDHVAIVERMVEMSFAGASDDKIATTLDSQAYPRRARPRDAPPGSGRSPSRSDVRRRMTAPSGGVLRRCAGSSPIPPSEASRANA
ncbi:recombinase family protein [Streptomyces sp. NBC_00233]|uniref:recombinase family protein n=1 Tax=Streptomyces sp. NBC_00233 TaxID=2975686 RepID=UPI002B1D5398|nr:recombinase family protein [Streptomyces sp. NBC_00233]